MSIFATWLAFADDEDSCPVEYRGSHVLPTDDAKRSGIFDLGVIPAFIRKPDDERLLAEAENEVLPWLRVSVNEETVLLDEAQVRELHRILGEWIERLTTPVGAS